MITYVVKQVPGAMGWVVVVRETGVVVGAFLTEGEAQAEARRRAS